MGAERKGQRYIKVGSCVTGEKKNEQLLVIAQLFSTFLVRTSSGGVVGTFRGGVEEGANGRK